jgi:hypothetical protein
VNRGGSWNNKPANQRVANRNNNNPSNRNNNLGFRLANTGDSEWRHSRMCQRKNLVQPDILYVQTSNIF